MYGFEKSYCVESTEPKKKIDNKALSQNDWIIFDCAAYSNIK